MREYHPIPDPRPEHRDYVLKDGKVHVTLGPAVTIHNHSTADVMVHTDGRETITAPEDAQSD